MIATLLTVTVIVVMTTGSAALYLLPVLIGVARRVPDIGAVAAVNILLGWTLIGWAAALAMALRSVRPAGPPVQVVQNFGPAVPPVPPSGAGRAVAAAAARCPAAADSPAAPARSGFRRGQRGAPVTRGGLPAPCPRAARRWRRRPAGLRCPAPP